MQSEIAKDAISFCICLLEVQVWRTAAQPKQLFQII